MSPPIGCHRSRSADGAQCLRKVADGEEGEAEPVNSSVSVEVSNQHALPMEIYVLGSGITHRLGTVHPGHDGRFDIPQNLLGSSVRLEARPGDNSRSFQSGELLLAPGSVVEFRVAAQIFSSTATLRQYR